MAVERTFSIVKRDAVANNLIGKIYSRFEANGLRVVAARMMRLSEEVAGGFYAMSNIRLDAMAFNQPIPVQGEHPNLSSAGHPFIHQPRLQ